MSWLRQRYPDNAFFHTLEGRVHWRFGNWDESDRVFREVMRRYGQGRTGYNDAAAEQALFYLARVEERRGNYDRALVLLRRLERLGARRPEASPFVILGRLQHGLAYDALGDRAAAVRRYREVLEMPDFAGSHDRARRLLTDAPTRAVSSP
jgi:tetratricopeptide (TPR) repeat protein